MPRVKHFPMLKENGVATNMMVAVSFRVTTPAAKLIGQPAPDFVLPGHDGKMHRLHRYLAQGPVCLFVFPLSGSPFCVKEACAFRTAQHGKPAFASSKVTIIGLCQDDLPRLSKFVAQHDLQYPVLSDMDRKVHDQWGVGTLLYGLLNKRVTYIIDSHGIVRGCAEGTFNYRGHLRFAEMWLARLESEDAFREQSGLAPEMADPNSFPRPSDAPPSSDTWGEDWTNAYPVGAGGNARAPPVHAEPLGSFPSTSGNHGDQSEPRPSPLELAPEPPVYQNLDELSHAGTSSPRTRTNSTSTHMDLMSRSLSHNSSPHDGQHTMRGPSFPSFHTPSSPSIPGEESSPPMPQSTPLQHDLPQLDRPPALPESAEHHHLSFPPWQVQYPVPTPHSPVEGETVAPETAQSTEKGQSPPTPPSVSPAPPSDGHSAPLPASAPAVTPHEPRALIASRETHLSPVGGPAPQASPTVEEPRMSTAHATSSDYQADPTSLTPPEDEIMPHSATIMTPHSFNFADATAATERACSTPNGQVGSGTPTPEGSIPTFRPEDFRSPRVRSLRSPQPSPQLVALRRTRLTHAQSTPQLTWGARLYPPPPPAA